MELVQIRGRGAAENPANRFERLHVELEPEALHDDEGEPIAPATQYFRDTTRGVLAHNDSPDVGFSVSLNPYRGCEHGCSYCLAGDTAILMADGRQKPLAELRVGDEICGTRRDGWYRRFVRTRVLAHWTTVKPAYRIRLVDGTVLVASGDHRFLTDRGWKHVAPCGVGEGQRPFLTTNNSLLGVGHTPTWTQQHAEYRSGYLCGVIRGDGLLAVYRYARLGRAHGEQHQFRLAMKDREALERTGMYLQASGVPTREFAFAHSPGASLPAIRTHRRAAVERIRRIIEWPAAPSVEWYRGYLGGIFDAEGSYSGGVLRISNTDVEVIEHVCGALRELAIPHLVEHTAAHRVRRMHVVRIRGGIRQHLRFFGAADPAIIRKCSIEGQALKTDAQLRIASIEPLGIDIPLFDITTGTGDFIANGVVSHNCYARPFHEYLGFSAGLDFETRIMVKTDAPELLRRELSSPRWVPQPIAMSGVTDPYQPVERRLRITRGCLEVLAQFRNPVGIVTKSHLVTRDVDLLAELAADGAAVVSLSITSLDPALQRVIEPRASTPARRLRAIETLAAAGVPVNVMVAPVVPGLTDHELPAILEAAAGAGARGAAFIVLRLPHGVGQLFEQWLAMHFPDRREKVLNRVRAMRGGKLNDPRFGNRMRGEGPIAEGIRSLFRVTARRLGLGRLPELSTDAFRRPPPRGQLELFG